MCINLYRHLLLKKNWLLSQKKATNTTFTQLQFGRWPHCWPRPLLHFLSNMVLLKAWQPQSLHFDCINTWYLSGMVWYITAQYMPLQWGLAFNQGLVFISLMAWFPQVLVQGQHLFEGVFLQENMVYMQSVDKATQEGTSDFFYIKQLVGVGSVTLSICANGIYS